MIPDDVLDKNGESVLPPFRLATVKTVTAAGVTIQFEEEETASDKVYAVLQSYAPAVNDRVVLLRISGTQIVLGSVGVPTTPTAYIPLAEKGADGGVATLNSNGRVVQTALNAVNATTATTATNASNATNATSATNAAHLTGNHIGNLLGFFGSSGASRRGVTSLGSSATLAQVISAFNNLLSALDDYNLINN